MKFVVFLIVVLSLLGCHSSGKPDKPDHLISKDKMVDILFDVYILNASKGANKTILETKGVYPENYIFDKYNIDSLQFALSNDYYGFYVLDYESIINRVEKRINDNKEIYKLLAEKEQKEKQRRRDSLRDLTDSIRHQRLKKPETKKERVDYKSYKDESSM